MKSLFGDDNPEITSMEAGYLQKLKTTTPRFIKTDMKPIQVRTSHTVASLFLGEGSEMEHIMFMAGVKSPVATALLWILWGIGAVVGLLVVMGAIPLNFVWVSLLMLPLPVVSIFLLSVDLLKELMCIDLLILFTLQFAMFLDGMVYCRGDIRRVFWLCYLPSMIASGVIDAYPCKYRAFFGKLFYTAAVIIVIIWNCLLIFKWEVFGTGSKLQHWAVIVHHGGDQLTVLAFYCRHIWCSIYRPDYFVMITASVCTQHRLDSVPE